MNSVHTFNPISSMGDVPVDVATSHADHLHVVIDEFHDALFAPIDKDRDIELAIESQLTHNPPIPDINVSKQQGLLLDIILRQVIAGSPNLSTKECRVVELGTLAGVSAIYMGRTLLPDFGKLVTIESNPIHVSVAQCNIEHAKLSSVVSVAEGDCISVLSRLLQDDTFRGKTDFVFIDADKDRYVQYLELAYKLCREGGLIFCDNTVQGGSIVLDEMILRSKIQNPRELGKIKGIKSFNKKLKTYLDEGKVKGLTLQTVGCKGHDGWDRLIRQYKTNSIVRLYPFDEKLKNCPCAKKSSGTRPTCPTGNEIAVCIH